jgi:two-component system sensor histidine kinase SenX3
VVTAAFVVFTAIGGLMVGILIGRRSEIMVAPQPRDGAVTATLVQHDGVVLCTRMSGVELPDPPVREPGLVRGFPPARPEERTSDESDSVRLEATWGDFVANVSHELKTPVGAVALLAEAVLDAADEPQEVRRFGTKILNEANRLGTLVTELIALSRLQGTEQLPEPGTVEVDEVVHEALARCRLAAESANIQITANPPSGLRLKGDATLLVTALSNLLDNAVSYSPAGSAVSVGRGLVNGMVEITVTDHGLGIAPEYQEQVFERFFRVDQARSRSSGGTGLGLAIVKHVAVNHGGDVQLWSKPGTGSTFTLRIPAHPDSPHHPSRAPSTPEYARGSLCPGC